MGRRGMLMTVAAGVSVANVYYAQPLLERIGVSLAVRAGALGLVSRHPFKARFEAKYGTELELLAMLKQKLGFFDGYEVKV